MTEFHSSAPFGGWDNELPISANDVVRRWRQLLSTDRPWRYMPLYDVVGTMRAMLSELLDEGRDLDAAGRRGRMLCAAYDHGAFRRAQGCRREDITCEFGILLDALDSAMARRGMSRNLIRDALSILDADLELAQQAAVAGWLGEPTRHRIRIESRFFKRPGGLE